MRFGGRWVAMALLGAIVAGCGDDDDDDAVVIDAAVDAGRDGSAFDAGSTRASATLAPRSGVTTLGGTATFTRTASGVSLMLAVTGAPVGQHGVHLHALGDCSAADALSAGGHWNPDNAQHGAPGATSHLGDLGNLTVAADGTGTLTVASTAWRIGDGSIYDVIGKSVIIHLNVDDLTTQPAGNAGSRIGCGVIQ